MDYDGLKDAIAGFLNRSDLAASIPTFVALAEAELNRVLDTRQMVEFARLTVNSERVLLPYGFAGVKSLRLNSPLRELTYLSPEAMDGHTADGGAPLHYTIIGDSLTFWPAPSEGMDARLRFRKRLEPVITAGTNWLLEQHPDAYLYGALKHSAGKLVEDERLTLWEGLFRQTVEQINADNRRQVEGAALQTRSGICA